MQNVATPAGVRPWLRPLYFLAGAIFLVVGVAGIFLPLVPTTGPLILAAFCFTRSSSRVHHWLVTHPRIGRFVRDFESSRAIPARVKLLAVVSMTAAFGYTIGWVATHPVARVLVIAVAAWAIGYVVRLPTERGGGPE